MLREYKGGMTIRLFLAVSSYTTEFDVVVSSLGL